MESPLSEKDETKFLILESPPKIIKNGEISPGVEYPRSPGSPGNNTPRFD